LSVILTERANASGWKDLGQRGVSAAGSGSELLHPKKDRFAISETGTGFAFAKLSEVLPPVASAPVVRMTQEARVARFVLMTKKNDETRFNPRAEMSGVQPCES